MEEMTATSHPGPAAISTEDLEMRRDSMPKRCSSQLRNTDTVDSVPDSEKTRHTEGLQVCPSFPKDVPHEEPGRRASAGE